MYALPVGLLILYSLIHSRGVGTRHAMSAWFPGILIAIIAFFLFSSPWWIFDFTHDHAALATFLTNRQSGEFEGIGIPYVPPSQRALGLATIGLPTLLGLKFPWEASYFLLPVGAIVLAIYGTAIIRLLGGHNPLKPDARALVLGMIALFCIIFVVSTFGADPTGRYFVVLALPFGIVLGTLVASFRPQTQPSPRHKEKGEIPGVRLFLPLSIAMERGLGGEVKAGITGWGWLLLALVLAYHAAGEVAAASSPTGITTQFDLVSHLPNTHDAELISFLDEEGIYHGYTNYWVAFRLAFLSGERMQFSAALPYKRDLSYNAADNRYRSYIEATEQAERIAYITTNLPELDARLQADWVLREITYKQAQVGVFHVYYDFAPTVPDLPAGLQEE
jgi:hypothetical protein